MNTNIRANFILYTSNLFKKMLICIFIFMILIFILMNALSLTTNISHSVQYELNQTSIFFSKDIAHYDHNLFNISNDLTKLLQQDKTSEFNSEITHYQAFFDGNFEVVYQGDNDFDLYTNRYQNQTSQAPQPFYLIYPIYVQKNDIYAYISYQYDFKSKISNPYIYYLISSNNTINDETINEYLSIDPICIKLNNETNIYYQSLLHYQDYNRLYYRQLIKYALFFSISIFVLVFLCFYMINHIKKTFIKYDDIYQKQIAELNSSHNQKQKELKEQIDELNNKLNQDELKLSRLAYDRKNEIDPCDYEFFLEGIHTLTKSEYKIFNYYLEGKDVKEILEILQIKDSTLRYHNRNIYSKLGVNSLKQLIRYGALMQSEKNNT